jgi:hypothetical protein
LIVKDYGFIKYRPFEFAMELLFISVIPALLMVFVVSKTRQLTKEETMVWFFTILIKLMVLHILMQLSGIYTFSFGKRYETAL